MESTISLRTGMISGTVLSALPNLLSEDIARTVILAAVGAVSSTLVTLALKALAGWRARRRGRK